MASRVTEARSHVEGSGGISVIGVHWSVIGKEEKCNWGLGSAMSGHRSVMGTWLHSLLELILGRGKGITN